MSKPEDVDSWSDKDVRLFLIQNGGLPGPFLPPKLRAEVNGERTVLAPFKKTTSSVAADQAAPRRRCPGRAAADATGPTDQASRNATDNGAEGAAPHWLGAEDHRVALARPCADRRPDPFHGAARAGRAHAHCGPLPQGRCGRHAPLNAMRAVPRHVLACARRVVGAGSAARAPVRGRHAGRGLCPDARHPRAVGAIQPSFASACALTDWRGQRRARHRKERGGA